MFSKVQEAVIGSSVVHGIANEDKVEKRLRLGPLQNSTGQVFFHVYLGACVLEVCVRILGCVCAQGGYVCGLDVLF